MFPSYLPSFVNLGDSDTSLHVSVNLSASVQREAGRLSLLPTNRTIAPTASRLSHAASHMEEKNSTAFVDYIKTNNHLCRVELKMNKTFTFVYFNQTREKDCKHCRQIDFKTGVWERKLGGKL